MVSYDWWDTGSSSWGKFDSTSFIYNPNKKITTTAVCGTYDTTVNCVVWNTKQYSYSANITTINSYGQLMNFERKDEIYFDNYTNDTLILSYNLNNNLTKKGVSIYNYAINTNKVRTPFKHSTTKTQTDYSEFLYKNAQWINSQNSKWYYSVNPDYNSNSVVESMDNMSNYFIVSIYPNPMLNEAVVRMDTPVEEANLEMYDITGSLVYSKYFSGNVMKINKENLASGLYTIVIVQNGVAIVRPTKLIIQ
jgi:hypothetical protein